VEYYDLSQDNQNSKSKVVTMKCYDPEINPEPTQPGTYSTCSPTSDGSFVPEDEEVEDDDPEKPREAKHKIATAAKKRKATDSDDNNSKSTLRKKSLRRKQVISAPVISGLPSGIRESTIEAEGQASSVSISAQHQRAPIEGPDVAIIPVENSTCSSAPEVLSQTLHELLYSVPSNSTYVHPVAVNRLPSLPEQMQPGLMYAHQTPPDGMWCRKSRTSVMPSYRSHPGAMQMSFMSDTSENVLDDYPLISQSPVAINIPLMDQVYSPPLNGLPEFISTTHSSFGSHTRPYSTPPLSVSAQSDMYPYTDTLCTSFGSCCNHNHQEDSVVSPFPRTD
jgi:hypothetical protein